MSTPSDDMDVYIKELEERVVYLEDRAQSSCKYSYAQVKGIDGFMTYNFYVGLILIAKGKKVGVPSAVDGPEKPFQLKWVCHTYNIEYYKTLQDMRKGVIETIWEM